jgi:hypothetical protein
MIHSGHMRRDGKALVCHRHTGPRHGGLLVCAVVIGVLALPGFAAAGERVLDERKSERVEAMILRVKPAVVGILTEVKAAGCGRDGLRSGPGQAACGAAEGPHAGYPE